MMMIRKMVVGVLISLITISVILAAADRKIQAQGTASDSEVSKKLDDILDNQKVILEGIASIKEELNVIKIRVTR